MTPIYYFGDNQNPVWSIAPSLPEGLVFENGRISGTPTEPSNETNYTITVLGEMVPVELFRGHHRSARGGQQHRGVRA